ncbi:MAG: hypothetical protein DRP11_00650, partial [Candidatus Aenigmatarchaeota archaeon]
AIEIREEITGGFTGMVNLITFLKLETENYGDVREAARLYMITRDSDIKDELNDVINKYENEVSIKLEVDGGEEDLGAGIWGYGSKYEMPVAYPEGEIMHVKISSGEVFFTEDLYLPEVTL